MPAKYSRRLFAKINSCGKNLEKLEFNTIFLSLFIFILFILFIYIRNLYKIYTLRLVDKENNVNKETTNFYTTK